MLLIGPRFHSAIQRTRILVLVLGAWCTASAQTAPITGTLPEDYLPGLAPILQAAVRQSPQVLMRESWINRKEGDYYQANRERWPNVGGNIRYDSNQTGVSGNSSSKSRDSGLFYNMSVDQALFHWGAIKNTGASAKMEVAIAGKDYQEAYRQLVIQIRTYYLDLVRRNALLRQKTHLLGLSEVKMKAIRDKGSRGLASPVEVAAAELDFSESQLALDRDQLEFDGVRRVLARLSGVKDIPPESIPAELPKPHYDAALSSQLLAGFLRDGGRNTFSAEAAEFHIKKADLDYKVARVRLLPKFNASVSHSRESSTTANATAVTQTAITRDTFEVRGSWTIFDGFATKGAKLTAKSDRRYWERQLQVETEAAMDEAQRLERIAALDARMMEFAEQRRTGAEQFLKRAQEDAQAGKASQADVDGAVQLLRSAEAIAADRRATFLLDWSTFVSRVNEDPALRNLPLSYVRATR